MPQISRRLAYVWVTAGAVGFVVSLILGISGWRWIGSTAETFSEVLTVTTDLLDSAEATAASVDAILVDAASGLSAVEGSLAEGGATLSEMSTLADDLGAVVSEDIPESLDALRATMPQLIGTAGVIDGVMRTLRFVGADYDPDAPLDDSLRALDAELATIPEELRSQGTGFEAAADGIGGVAGSTVEIAREIGSIRSSLSASRDIVSEAEASVREGRVAVDRLDTQIATEARLARVGLVALSLTMAAVHTVPLTLGWGALASKEP